MKKTTAILTLFLAIALGAPAMAAIQQIRVLGVGVANSSQKAEEAAVDYAKKRAVYLTARKMQVENASAKVAALKPEELARIVRGATVTNSRREREITYADVSVSVVDTELRRALGLPATAMAAVEPAAAHRSVLVLPAYRKADRIFLWEEENPLREALRSEILRQSKGLVLVPAGDFEDLRLIDHANASTVTGAELKPMFERYGAQEIIIVIVTLGEELTADPTQVTLRRLTPEGARVEVIKVPATDPKDTAEARLNMAAHAIAGAVTQIATSTSVDEQQSLADASHQNVMFDYANPRELGQLEEAVRHTAGVIFLEIPSITLDKVGGKVYFTGETATLKAELMKKNVVVRDGGGGWTLSLR
jgi:hypothetical protein